MNKTIVSLFFGLSLAALGQTINVSPNLSPLSKKEAKALELRASTPQDHSQLVAYYRARASHERVESQMHLTEAAYFKKNPSLLASKHPFIHGTEAHCLWMSGRYARSAKKSDELANKHEQLVGARQSFRLSGHLGG